MILIKIAITLITFLLCVIFYKLYDTDTRIDTNALAIALIIRELEKEKENNVCNNNTNKQECDSTQN